MTSSSLPFGQSKARGRLTFPLVFYIPLKYIIPPNLISDALIGCVKLELHTVTGYIYSMSVSLLVLVDTQRRHDRHSLLMTIIGLKTQNTIVLQQV